MPCGPSTDQHHCATAGSSPVWLRVPPALPVLRNYGPDRPAGHDKAVQALASRPLAPKPDWAGSLPGDTGSPQVEAVVVLSVAVRSGPLRAAVNGPLLRAREHLCSLAG
jgi:hypothetical protein